MLWDKKKVVLFLILLLSLTILLLGCKEEDQSMAVYETDFNNASGWYQGNRGSYTLSHEANKYQIDIEKAGYKVWEVAPALPMGPNYAVQAQMEITEGTGYYSIIFDYVDDDNFYLFTVDPHWGRYGLTKVSFGSWHDVIEWEKDHQAINHLRNHLRVVNEQGELELYINGELVDRAEINPASKGVKAGLAAATFNDSWFAQANFDNFSYSGISHDVYQEYEDEISKKE